MKPTVGRIVHFYDLSLKDQRYKNVRNNNGLIDINGVGAGPYPALVLQVSASSDDYINLRVDAWGGSWPEGSVEEYSESKNDKRYWVWPPKVE